MSFFVNKIGDGINYVADGLNRAATGFALARDTSSALAERNIRVQDVHRSQLISDISNKILSKYLPGDREQVGGTIHQLIEHIFFVFALKDLQVEENQELPEDLLVDHFFSSVLRLTIDEFQNNPHTSTKEHFVNIANTMLNTAFPGGTWDEKIPRAMRYLLSDNIFARSIAKLVVDKEQDLSWKGITELLADYLEGIYSSISHTPQRALDPASGANQMIGDIRSWLDTKTKNTKTISWFANKELSESSNLFVNRFFTRLLRAEAQQQEDSLLLNQVRTWALDHMQTSMQVLYELIFTPVGDESEDQRRVKFADKVLANAVQVLPRANRDLNAIDQMSYEEITHELAIRKQELQDKPKEQLKSLVLADALKLILENELRPAELATRLPSFCSPETALSYLYSFLSSYVVETMMQLETISTTRSRLTGGEISQWVDTGLEWAKNAIVPKRQDRVLQLTRYPFMNRLASHMLRSSNPVAAGYVEDKLKSLVHVILDKAVGDNTANPEEALAQIANSILQQGQDKVLELMEQEHPEEAFLHKATDQILATALSKEHFTGILPPFLRESGVWELLVDYLAGYFTELHNQTKKIKELEASKEYTVEEPDLKRQMQSLHETILEWLDKPQEERGETAYERFKNQLTRGQGLKNVARYVLPKLLEPLVAFHLNPKDGISSQEKASSLIMKFIAITQNGFDAIDEFEAAPNRREWLLSHGYTDEVLLAYRKAQDIPDDKDFDLRDLLLHEVAEKLVCTLLPPELLRKVVPDEESICNIDRLIANYTFSYLQRAYNYSNAMRELMGLQQDALVDELETFVAAKIEDYFESDDGANKTWIEEVTRRVFCSENEEQKAQLKKFIPNIYYGAIGYVIQNANGRSNLLTLFAPVARDAQNLFLVLNKKLSFEETAAELKVTEDEVARCDSVNLFHWVAARRALDTLYSDEQWKSIIPELLQGFLTKDRAANFLVNIYDTIHKAQQILQQEEAAGAALIRQEAGLEEFLESFFVENIICIVKELGQKEGPLNSSLPALFDTFLKQCASDEGEVFGSIRDTVIRRLIFTMAKRVKSSDTPVVEQAKAIIQSYKRKDTFATAELLIKTLLPDALMDTPLAKLMLSDVVKRQIGTLVGQFHESQERIIQRTKEAKSYLNTLPGMKSFYDDMMQGLDDQLDDFSKPGINRICDDFPDYVDELLKEALRDPELGPITREFFRSVVTIIIAHVCTPKPGQKVEERVLEALQDIVQDGNWMQTLLPKETIKELLPECLQNVITHEKLLKWFFKPYVDQVAAEGARIEAEVQKASDANVDRMQRFVKELLLGYTRPYATKRGFFGREGVIREIERGLLGALEDRSDDILTPRLQNYLNATISQVTRGLEKQGLLDPQYVTQALIASLDMLDSDIPAPANMPAKEQFATACKDRLLEMCLPEGKAALFVPDVAKEVVWKKVSTSIEEFFTEITDCDKRMVWLLDRIIPLVTRDESLLKERLQAVEDLRMPILDGKPKDAAFAVKTEAMFKRYVTDFALQKAEENIDKKGWWWPIAWIAKQIMKAITYLYVRFSLRDRLHAFLMDERSNEKIRRLLWAFLHATPSPNQPNDPLKLALLDKLKSALGTTGITPNMLNNYFAGELANLVFGKNIVDILCE